MQAIAQTGKHLPIASHLTLGDIDSNLHARQQSANHVVSFQAQLWAIMAPDDNPVNLRAVELYLPGRMQSLARMGSKRS